MQITWLTECPAEIRTAFQPYLLRHVHLVPDWVLELRIGYDDSSDAGLSMIANPEYRLGLLRVCAGFLSGSEGYRESSVIHELVHLMLAPIDDLTKDLIIELARGDDRLDRMLRERLRQAQEMTTCDLTAVLQRAAHGGTY